MTDPYLTCSYCKLLYRGIRVYKTAYDQPRLLDMCYKCYLKHPHTYGPVICKRCPKCLSIRYIEEFNRNNNNIDKLNSYCKKCTKSFRFTKITI